MNIPEHRKAIDKLDGQLIKLLNERTKHVLAIGEIKLKAGEEIYAPHRERAVLQRLCRLNQGPITNDSLRAIYREIMSSALSLARQGAKVLVTDVNLESAQAVASHIKSAGGDAQATRVDVSQAAEIQRMIAIAEELWGGIDCLLNNAESCRNDKLDILLNSDDEFWMEQVRGKIMPVNRKYPLKVLLEACDYYVAKKRRMMFEYILIAGINDSDEQASELAKIARRLSAKINLIPYNTVEGLEWSRPSRARQEQFQSILRQHGVVATLRREKGHDIAAACGQLRLQTKRAERAVRLSV